MAPLLRNGSPLDPDGMSRPFAPWDSQVREPVAVTADSDLAVANRLQIMHHLVDDLPTLRLQLETSGGRPRG